VQICENVIYFLALLRKKMEKLPCFSIFGWGRKKRGKLPSMEGREFPFLKKALGTENE
jgi:hypothetical protein